MNGGIANSNSGLIGPGKREVVRCGGCHLVQFRTISDRCRRCERFLPRPNAELEAVEAPPQPVMAVPEIAREAITHEVQFLPRPEGPYRTKTVGKHALGPRLRELREFKNLTQADIAVKARVPRTYISRIERAHLMPGLGVLQRLSAALGVGLLDLVPGNGAIRVPGKFASPAAVGEAAGISSDSYWDSLVRYSRSLAEDQKALILSKVRAMLGPHPIGRVA